MEVVVPVLTRDFGIQSVSLVRLVFGWPLDSAVALYRMISHDEIGDRTVEGREHDLRAKLNHLLSNRNL